MPIYCGFSGIVRDRNISTDTVHGKAVAENTGENLRFRQQFKYLVAVLFSAAIERNAVYRSITIMFWLQ